MSIPGKWGRWFVLAGALAAALALQDGSPALAQQGGGFRRPSINVQAFNACTTTDYTGLIAKTLNITPAALRKDIVNGQTLQDLATGANVDPQTVVTAYQTARKADIDQAVKDGVMTQDEATALEATPTPAATQAATAPARPGGPGGPGPRPPGGGPGAQFPDISNLRFLIQQVEGTPSAPGAGGGFGGGGIGLGISAGTFNLVKQYAVAAEPLNMKCADLVKALITPPGQSIATLATAQKVDPKTISDALTKAYTDALAQDVTDSVITQAESDELTPLIAQAVTAFVSNPLPMGVQATPTPQS